MYMGYKHQIFIISAFLAISVCVEATIIRVPADQPTIQAGINAASTGDTVLVANGTYSGSGNDNLDFSGKAIIVRSESGPISCIIQGGPSSTDRAIQFHSGETTTSQLDGFTIRDFEYSGAISCTSGSSPQISNCMISSNAPGALQNGAGLYCSESNPAILNCTFDLNSCGLGGGVYCQGSSAKFTNCTFLSNSASAGAAAYFLQSSPEINDCEFSSNLAAPAVQVEGDGYAKLQNCAITDNDLIGFAIAGAGSSYLLENSTISNNGGNGIYDRSWEPSKIVNCTISGNFGGMYSEADDVTLVNCIIYGNDNPVNGGGLCIKNSNTTTCENCLITGNSSSGLGGGIYIESSNMILKSCTIFGNTASLGGSFASYPAAITAVNCIFWGNSPIDAYTLGSPTVTITYSDLQQSSGVYPGSGNMNSDPIFATGPDGDCYLSRITAGQMQNSPCLDAGSNLASAICYPSDAPEFCLNQTTTQTDFAIDYGTADMGYHRTIPAPPIPAMSPGIIWIPLAVFGFLLGASRRKA
jgi:hypothetical protein